MFLNGPLTTRRGEGKQRVRRVNASRCFLHISHRVVTDGGVHLPPSFLPPTFLILIVVSNI